MRVLFKKTAIDDLLETERYIREQLHNPAAAKRLTRTVYASAMRLERFPRLGTELSGRFDQESDLRYLPAAGQLIFYRIVEDEHVEVTRVLNGRQDYLSILFD